MWVLTLFFTICFLTCYLVLSRYIFTYTEFYWRDWDYCLDPFSRLTPRDQAFSRIPRVITWHPKSRAILSHRILSWSVQAISFSILYKVLRFSYMCLCPCNSENVMNSLYYNFDSVQEVCSILLYQKIYRAENVYCTQGLARCKSSHTLCAAWAEL